MWPEVREYSLTWISRRPSTVSHPVASLHYLCSVTSEMWEGESQCLNAPSCCFGLFLPLYLLLQQLICHWSVFSCLPIPQCLKFLLCWELNPTQLYLSTVSQMLKKNSLNDLSSLEINVAIVEGFEIMSPFFFSGVYIVDYVFAGAVKAQKSDACHP